MVGLFNRSYKNPNLPSVHNKKKELRKAVKDKKYDKALKIGDEILKRIPHEQDVLFIVGGIHYMRGKYKTAISFFDRSLEIATLDTEVLILKATAHYKLGQTKECMDSCEKIKEVDPKNKAVVELLENIENKKS